MPQMSPMNWLTLFILFTLIIIIFNIMNFYNISNSPLKHSEQTKKKTINWKW